MAMWRLWCRRGELQKQLTQQPFPALDIGDLVSHAIGYITLIEDTCNENIVIGHNMTYFKEPNTIYFLFRIVKTNDVACYRT